MTAAQQMIGRIYLTPDPGEGSTEVIVRTLPFWQVSVGVLARPEQWANPKCAPC
jgi:hypothetical protein